ncbi:kinesin-like protein KIFC1, partial [Stegodyphus dumicola]|uniref:kinesin-like protein KIFC1 n=1 Tax=Stegodyphus dumicola TaxID=202533 RepID=UPI0015AF59A5
MSRIPKIGTTGSLKTKNSTDNMLPPPAVTSQRTTSSVLRTGVKRAGDSQAGLSEKRQKTNVEAPVKRNGFGSTVRSHTVDKIATFSDKSKRAVLQPLPDNELIRGSMPAVLPTAKIKGGLKSKRPAWDLKGRIQDMEEHFNKTLEQNSTLKQELQAYNQRIAALEATNSLLYKDVEIKSSQSEEASSQINRLENTLKQKTEEYDKLAKESEAEIKKLKDSNESLTRELATLNDIYQQETSALRNSISSLTCSKSGLQAQLDATENMLEALRQEMKQLQAEKLNKEKEITDLLQQVVGLESKLRNEESTRRKLHNMVQELKV